MQQRSAQFLRTASDMNSHLKPHQPSQVSFLINRGNQSSSCESSEIAKDLEEFVEHMMVKDRALNRMTSLIRIRDPCNGNLLATIRDPKCKIEPYKRREGIIDIQEHIEKRELP